jgi:hypothetical protein
MELLAIARDDPRGLLPTMLESVEPKVGHIGRFGVPKDPEDAALIVEVIVVAAFALNRRLRRRRIEHDETTLFVHLR